MGMCGGGLCLCRAGRFVRVHGTAMVFKIMRVAAVSVELWSDGGLVYGVNLRTEHPRIATNITLRFDVVARHRQTGVPSHAGMTALRTCPWRSRLLLRKTERQLANIVAAPDDPEAFRIVMAALEQ